MKRSEIEIASTWLVGIPISDACPLIEDGVECGILAIVFVLCGPLERHATAVSFDSRPDCVDREIHPLGDDAFKHMLLVLVSGLA